MIHVAIVDDEEQSRKRIKKCLDYVADKKKTEFSVREFSNADAFLVGYEAEYDIVFMDIEMDGTDGMEAARQLRKIDKNVILIFVTNIAQMAIQGYEVEALDFIVKPIDPHAFALKMVRALGRVAKDSSDRFIINVAGDAVSLHTHLIKYLEVNGHYVVYHTKEGDYSEYISLSAAEKKLKGGAFIRCNRGYLVNLKYVDTVTKDYCVVDGEELIISRPQKKTFMEAFADFLGGKKL